MPGARIELAWSELRWILRPVRRFVICLFILLCFVAFRLFFGYFILEGVEFLFDFGVDDMGVEVCHVNRFVAEDVLHFFQVVTAVDQVHAEGVAE